MLPQKTTRDTTKLRASSQAAHSPGTNLAIATTVQKHNETTQALMQTCSNQQVFWPCCPHLCERMLTPLLISTNWWYKFSHSAPSTPLQMGYVQIFVHKRWTPSTVPTLVEKHLHIFQESIRPPLRGPPRLGTCRSNLGPATLIASEYLFQVADLHCLVSVHLEDPPQLIQNIQPALLLRALQRACPRERSCSQDSRTHPTGGAGARNTFASLPVTLYDSDHVLSETHALLHNLITPSAQQMRGNGG